MAQKTTKPRAWTKEDVRALKTLAREKTTVIARKLKRSVGATHQKVMRLGVTLGGSHIRGRKPLLTDARRAAAACPEVSPVSQYYFDCPTRMGGALNRSPTASTHELPDDCKDIADQSQGRPQAPVLEMHQRAQSLVSSRVSLLQAANSGAIGGEPDSSRYVARSGSANVDLTASRAAVYSHAHVTHLIGGML
jgi:hypothetical protein